MADDNKSDIEKILAERAKLDEVLRTQFTKKITVMFTDIKGSTAFYEQHGDVDGRLLVHRHNELVLPVIEEHKGVLIKTIGDATMSVFDDPADAVRAAKHIQEKLLEANSCLPESEQINVRIGLNTGLGIVDEKDVFGDVVNTASRVEALADGGEILATEDLFREVKDKKEFVFRFAESAKVKGKKGSVKAYRLVWHEEELSQGKTYKVSRSPQPAKTAAGGARAAAPVSHAARGNSFRIPRAVKILLSVLVALALVMLIVDMVSEGILTDDAAVATRIDGTARVFARDGAAGRTISLNDRIGKRDRVEVEGSSKLELRLPDGGYLRLTENAKLTLRMLTFEKQTGFMNLQASIDKGRVWMKMRKDATAGSSVEMITQSALISAKDGVCAVDAGENAATTVSVYEGTVQAASAPKGAASAAGQAKTTDAVPPVTVQALQQITVPAPEGAAQPHEFDPKASLTEWVRWNLQRDAREGLVSVTVAPEAATATRGSTIQFTGTAHYPDKSEKDVTWFATWGTSDAKIAKVDASGSAAGSEIGAANISAAIDDMSGSTMFTVSRDLQSIAVTPAAGSVVNGGSLQFTATGTFSDKAVKDITSSVVWKSSNANVAFVDASGRVVGGNVSGTAVISASQGTRTGSAKVKVHRELVSITILPENATVMQNELQRFGAIGNYSDKTTQDLTEQAYWETSDGTIAEIDEAQPGRVIGKNKYGSATIKASFKGKSGTGTLTVAPLNAP